MSGSGSMRRRSCPIRLMDHPVQLLRDELLTRLSGGFRVLALSAMPGSSVEKVQEVISALRISRLESRDDHSIDVMHVLNAREQQTLRLSIGGR